MSDKEEYESTLARLTAATRSADLSDALRAHAAGMRTRLSTGVRVVVLGPPGSGKSALCDALLCVPGEVAGHGGVARVIVRAGAETPAEVFPGSGAPTELDAGFLTDTCLVDVHLPRDEKARKARALEALEHADIVIWCTSRFGPDEADIWSHAPDHLKDHSFLVLGKADQLVETGQLNDRISDLQDVAAEEFHSLHPTSALTIAGGLSVGQIPDEKQRAASGIKALSDTVLHIAASGRRADMDSALLFLERHSIGDGAGAGDVSADVAADKAPGLRRVRDLISEHADQLCAAGPVTDGKHDRIFDICNGLSEALTDVISDDESGCQALSAWEHELFAASDKLVLMGLENDSRSAADAVAIVMQLSRDLHHSGFESNPR
ncbi:GTPase domain-containing protein [uncultured Roseobacter sp.]|uniref:GTPase domain-containing protein n=1 Tax=uncultured Roseobacter sp. TaxID=114847 RepID=UPI00262D43C2|nr:GTPase domain-containing protein [uncultured Roseobacter sp.]